MVIVITWATSALPDMYARNPRVAGPRAEGLHIRQSTSVHVIVKCVTLLALLKST